MAEIKRYTTAQIISQKLGCEFVKYDDVKGLDQPACNCEEMIGMWRKLEWEGINRQKACGHEVYIVNNKTEFTWFCPAHGYKRR